MPWTRLRGVVRAYLMAFAFWYSLGVLMGIQYLPLDRHHPWSSLLTLSTQGAAHAFPLALWTPPIFYFVGKYIGRSQQRVRYLLLWTLGAVPFVLVHTAIAYLVSPPYTARTLHLWLEVLRGAFADSTLVYISIVVAAHGYEYLKRVRQQEAERYEYQQALVASELQALKMQLQPHFLFNTLHGIATLVDADSAKAKTMILKLSSLLRSSLERDSVELVPLQEELRFVGEYLELEKMRFGSRLRVDWAVAVDTGRVLVPQMLLQPLVENAIRHGVATLRQGGWIEVAANRNNGRLNLCVRNSTGATATQPNRDGVGLRNVEARLQHLYSGEASLRLDIDADHVATVNVVLPALDFPPAGDPPAHGRKEPACAFSSSTTNP